MVCSQTPKLKSILRLGQSRSCFKPDTGRCRKKACPRDFGNRRVLGVYLSWANLVFLPFFAFSRMSKLRGISGV